MNSGPAPIAARPRAEALRRGLLESLVVTDDAAVLPIRASRWSDTFRPLNDFQSWLVGQVAELSLRLDRCGRSERRLRERASFRAETCWNDDRARQAEAVGVKLADRPAEVVARLRQTAAGCDWLMRRWALLAHAADGGPWTAEQGRLAFDLLATPDEFRQGRPGVEIDAEGHEVDAATDPAAVARGQIAGLRDRRDRLAGAEDVDRALVAAGLFDDPSPEIRRLHRHEASLHRRLAWCLKQLGTASADLQSHPEVKPDQPPQAPPVPSRPARDLPSYPPIDWEPDGYPALDDDIDPIALAESRREIRAQLAAFQREEARRLGLPHA